MTSAKSLASAMSPKMKPAMAAGESWKLKIQTHPDLIGKTRRGYYAN